MHNVTHDWIAKRALESGISLEKIPFLTWSDITDSNIAKVWTIQIWVNGTDLADYLFLGETLYEVNVADWLAELFQYNPPPAKWHTNDQPITKWEILVGRMTVTPEPIHYKIGSDS